MATLEGRSLTIERSNVTQYVTADNLTLDTAYLGNDCAFRSSAKTGYAILNDAAKAVLFPNATVKPLKADSTMQIGASTKNNNNYVELQFSGTSVHHQLCANANETKTGLTDAAIIGATQNTEIRYKVNINNLFVAAIVTHVILTLYFNQYAMSANIGTGATGVKSVSSSASVAYDGDTITFSAELYSGATWNGWYSDAACTNLVSSSQSYSVSPNADITLYAKATREVTGTSIYLKQNGAYTQAQAIYKKVNGVWTETDKTALDTATKYKIINT